MMVIGVKFVDDEFGVFMELLRQEASNGRIELGMDRARPVEHISGERPLPNREAPGIGGSLVDALLVGPVQIDFEPRSLGDNLCRRDRGPKAREGVFFAKPVGFGKDNFGSDFVADKVPIVQRHSNDGTVSLDDFPGFHSDRKFSKSAAVHGLMIFPGLNSGKMQQSSELTYGEALGIVKKHFLMEAF